MLKKITPSILIFIITASIFAPFSVGIDKNNTPTINKNKAEAVYMDINVVSTKVTENLIDISFKIKREKSSEHKLFYVFTDTPGTTKKTITISNYEALSIAVSTIGVSPVKPGDYTLEQIVEAHLTRVLHIDSPDKVFSLPAGAAKIPLPGIIEMGSGSGETVDPTNNKYLLLTKNVMITGLSADHPYYLSIFSFNGDATYSMVTKLDNEFRTTKVGVVDTNTNTIVNTGTSSDPMPDCVFAHPSSGTFTGCMAQMTYYVLFVPSSFVFALTGQFFDYTFSYSVSDKAYRSGFVVEGWGIIRDFCNIFFIFVLLYVAFSTILSIQGFKTKEMIINVVIIGLLINFSLFAAQVLIDTSNILARVFYNGNTIIQKGGANGVTNATPGLKLGPNGEVPLSAAFINKVNPQNLILGSSKITVIDTGKVGGDTSLGAGTFLLITLLATAVNVVGIIVFLSVGMIFVARVIGLWLAMIFAPLAFFSYTVPAMKDIEMVGWKKWWPDTLKLAFLAPVFIFFIYLILKFLDTGLDLIHADGQTGIAFVIATVVPFVFIMMLLWKAKSIASELSGKLGQSISGGIAAVGGVALGAATGGAAFLGRASIGRLANKAASSDWVNDAAAGKKGTNPLSKFALQRFGKIAKATTSATAKGSFDFRQTGAGNAFSKQTGMDLNKGTNFVGLDTKQGLGGYVGVQQRKIEKENEFSKSLGFNHHDYEELEDKISDKEDTLAKSKAGLNKDGSNILNFNPNSTKHKANIAKQEYDIAGLKKTKERVKTGREKEYALTQKRKSGKIYDIDLKQKDVDKMKEKYENETDPAKKAKKQHEYEHAKDAFENKDRYRDDFGNIKKFGHAHSDAARAGKQIMKEALEGTLKGIAAGLVVGGPLGVLGGGAIGLVRELSRYSGTTNRKVGESHDDKHETITDKYKAADTSHAEPSHDTHDASDVNATPAH